MKNRLSSIKGSIKNLYFLPSTTLQDVISFIYTCFFFLFCGYGWCQRASSAFGSTAEYISIRTWL